MAPPIPALEASSFLVNRAPISVMRVVKQKKVSASACSVSVCEVCVWVWVCVCVWWGSSTCQMRGGEE